MTGFVKAMRTEESTLLDMHPNANHMLNVIARRARRTPCLLNKLEVGECFIGHKGLGLTERQYRTAKKQLEEWRMVEFKKGRKATDKGTVAKLLNSKVYDTNEKVGDGRKTDERRKGDGKETTNKECKKEKNEINNWDYDRCLEIWNEVKDTGICEASGCRIVPKEIKSGLAKVHKEYKKYCVRTGKTELEKHEWFRAYATGHLKRCSTFVGKNDSYSWKPSMKDLAKLETFEKIINE